MSDYLPAPANVILAGHRVSPIAWGMWRFAGVDVSTARARIDAAFEAGVTLFDTADIYGCDTPGGFGSAEALLGEVFAEAPGLRDKMVQSILPLIVRFLTAGALLWTVTPKFALFIMGFVVVAIFAAVKTAPKATLLSMNDADASSRLTGYIVDSVTNLSVVQQNSGWREELSRLDTAHAELNETFRARSRFISNFWGSFDAVAIFFFSGFMLSHTLCCAPGDPPWIFTTSSRPGCARAWCRPNDGGGACGPSPRSRAGTARARAGSRAARAP